MTDRHDAAAAGNRRLRMIFRSGARSVAGDPTVETPPACKVELTIFAGDSVARGSLALTAERVTDLMNGRTEFEFADVYVESLDDDHWLQLEEVVIGRDEILAVGVTGPRGDPRRRVRTRPIPVDLRVGRYEVSGNLHALPGTDPLLGWSRRGVMAPLTEAVIEFDAPEGRRTSRFAALLVNRELTDSVGPASRSDVRPPELIPDLQGGPLVKDFTNS